MVVYWRPLTNLKCSLTLRNCLDAGFGSKKRNYCRQIINRVELECAPLMWPGTALALRATQIMSH